MRQLTQLLLVVCLLVSPFGLAPCESGDGETQRKIAALAKAHADLDMFSGTVLVARHGKIVYAGAFGQAGEEEAPKEEAGGELQAGNERGRPLETPATERTMRSERVAGQG